MHMVYESTTSETARSAACRTNAGRPSYILFVKASTVLKYAGDHTTARLRPAGRGSRRLLVNKIKRNYQGHII